MKLKQIYARIVRETDDEQSAAGRYNPGLVAIVDNHRLPLSAGGSDDITAFTDGSVVYVLSVNYGLRYVGLQSFCVKGDYAGEEAGSVFLESEDRLREMVGKKGLDYVARTLTARLSEYI